MPDDQPRTVGLLDRLQALLGPSGLLLAPEDLAPHLTDWRGLYRGSAPCLLRPANAAELAEAVRLCAAAGVPLVPQGGNTSMVGGATPDASGAQIPVSLARLNRVRDVDPVDMTMTVEAGVVVKAAQDAAAAAGCLFPLSFGGEGSATVGGMLSTNAGGNTTVRYGNARDLVLGLEAVLPDGQVWNGLRRLRKTTRATRCGTSSSARRARSASSPPRCCASFPARGSRRWRSALWRARTRRFPCSSGSATATKPRCALRIHVGRRRGPRRPPHRRRRPARGSARGPLRAGGPRLLAARRRVARRDRGGAGGGA
jgi:hypothetical protein